MNNQPICYIFGAEEHHDPPSARPSSYDLVIAADGGYLYTEQHAIAEDLVLGDFDSLPEPPKGNADIVVLPQEKMTPI